MKPDRMPTEKLACLPEIPVTLQPFDPADKQRKIAHAYSKREYYRWKDAFIAGIVEGL